MSQRLSRLKRSINGSVAIVTGAASGMGRATAQLLADEGAKLAVLDINAVALESVAREIGDTGSEVFSVTVDLANRGEVQRAINEVVQHYGAIDILINNAGFAVPCELESTEFEALWDSCFAIMATAQAWAIRAALPALRKSPHPRIVNLASTEAMGATPRGAAYTVAKHACVGLTRSMAVDLGPEGITVNCVCPGPINTALTAPIPDDQKALFAKRRTALRRYGDPEEVAHAILSLVIPAASYITGATLAVDGGLTIRNA